ncbi:hypothetical protein M569_05604, partial [Genlisea aurea]
ALASRCSSELDVSSISDISGILHNKVLVSAAVSAAIGQFSKPFTSSLFYGMKFDWRKTVEAGGFPSTHSSAAVATATSLLLERGFSDAIFGLAVVYASLVMYDAQAVRREVGIHAKVMNKLVLRNEASSSSSSTTDPPVASSSFEDPTAMLLSTPPLLLKPDVENQTSNSEQLLPGLKESIGHTEIEVVSGALLGFLVSIAICPY